MFFWKNSDSSQFAGSHECYECYSITGGSDKKPAISERLADKPAISERLVDKPAISERLVDKPKTAKKPVLAFIRLINSQLSIVLVLILLIIVLLIYLSAKGSFVVDKISPDILL